MHCVGHSSWTQASEPTSVRQPIPTACGPWNILQEPSKLSWMITTSGGLMTSLRGGY